MTKGDYQSHYLHICKLKKMLIQLTKSRDTTNKEINLKHIQSKHTQPLVSQVHHCALWKSEQDG